MKKTDVEHNELYKVRYTPAPEFITCPKCGWYIELWTDTEETACLFCGFEAFQNSKTIH